jgi:hypothetical protein
VNDLEHSEGYNGLQLRALSEQHSQPERARRHLQILRLRFSKNGTGWIDEQGEAVSRRDHLVQQLLGSRPGAALLAKPMNGPTAWLAMRDSNSKMSAQNIPLKTRTDFRELSCIVAETQLCLRGRCSIAEMAGIAAIFG